MKVYVDEDIGGQFAAGMQAFGEDVEAVPRHVDDVDWYPQVAATGGVVVMRDRGARHKPLEVKRWRELGLGGFVLRGKNLDRCAIIRTLVRAWPHMKQLAARTPRRFLFVIRPQGGKIEPA